MAGFLGERLPHKEHDFTSNNETNTEGVGNWGCQLNRTLYTWTVSYIRDTRAAHSDAGWSDSYTHYSLRTT
jgi:hypothetical protein